MPNLFASATTNEELDDLFRELADEIHCAPNASVDLATRMQIAVNDYQARLSELEQRKHAFA